MAFTKEKDNKAILTSHFINLYNLALIDHKLHEDELNFLYQLGERHGISRAEVRDIINNSYQTPYSPPTNSSQKVEVLFDLASMMIVDGKLDEREALLCTQMAKEMGLNPQIVGEVVNLLVTGIYENIDESLVKRDLANLVATL